MALCSLYLAKKVTETHMRTQDFTMEGVHVVGVVGVSPECLEMEVP